MLAYSVARSPSFDVHLFVIPHRSGCAASIVSKKIYLSKIYFKYAAFWMSCYKIGEMAVKSRTDSRDDKEQSGDSDDRKYWECISNFMCLPLFDVSWGRDPGIGDIENRQ